MKTIKPSKIISILGILLATSFIFITPTFADDANENPACNSTVKAVLEANGCPGYSDNSNALPNTAVNIINAIISVTGIIAVIFIIIGGIQYMTSAGDTSKIQKAKNTILYAIIGLMVCVLAFAIVNFTVTKILNLS